MCAKEDFPDHALSVLKKQLESRGLMLDLAAQDLYRKQIKETLREKPSFPEHYLKKPFKLEDDIAVFVSNLMKARRENEIFVSSVDVRQLKKAFAKCGPHRIRC